MATISLETLLARSRTIATQMGGDAGESLLIDNKAGLRALLNHAILEVYRRKAKDPRFLRDITDRSTVAIVSGSGAVPTTILKEFLHLADFTDDNNSLVAYYDYAVDYNSSANFNQLGYVYILGANFQYTQPGGALYTGNLFVTTPTAPAVATSMIFQSEQTIDDIVLLLAEAIAGKVNFEVVTI